MANEEANKNGATKTAGSALRRILGLGLIAGAAYAVWRAIEANRAEHDTGWRAQPFPFPPEPSSPDAVTDGPDSDPAPD
jgi:hypothetical protein